MSAGHVGCTRSSGIVSSALWMSMVHSMRGVCGVCDMCMYLALGGVGGEGVWVFTNPLETGGVLDGCLCLGLRCRLGVCKWLGPGSGGLGRCYVCVSCEYGFLCVDGRSKYLYNVPGRYLRISGAPSVQSCCTLWIYASYIVFVLWQISKNPDLFVCGCPAWILSR